MEWLASLQISRLIKRVEKKISSAVVVYWRQQLQTRRDFPAQMRGSYTEHDVYCQILSTCRNLWTLEESVLPATSPTTSVEACLSSDTMSCTTICIEVLGIRQHRSRASIPYRTSVIMRLLLPYYNPLEFLQQSR